MFPTTHCRSVALRGCARFLDGCPLTYVRTPTFVPHSTHFHPRYELNAHLFDLFHAIVFAIVAALRNGPASKIAHGEGEGDLKQGFSLPNTHTVACRQLILAFCSVFWEAGPIAPGYGIAHCPIGKKSDPLPPSWLPATYAMVRALTPTSIQIANQPSELLK
jgi:hypothetical protein